MFSPGVKQTWLSSSILINLLGTGMQFGFASCLLEGLKAPDSTIKLSLEASSWLVASFGLAAMLGYLLATLLLDRIGRRLTFGTGLMCCIISLIMVYYAEDATLLFCARILGGLSSGGTFTVGAVCIGEYCSPRHRVMFLNMKTAMAYIGTTIVNVIGHYFHWRTVALVMLIIYVVGILITCTWPESPYWLAMKGRFTESEEAFYNIRGTSEYSVREIEELIRTQRDTRKIAHNTLSQKVSILIRKFMKRNFWKPLFLFFFASIVLETSGRHVFLSYTIQIIAKLADKNPYAFHYNLALNVLMTVSALVSVYLIRIMKLRKLLLSTGSVACVLLAISCIYIYLVEKQYLPKGYTVIPMSLFGLYLIFVNLGCATVPLVLMGEIFPLEHRAMGVSIAAYIITINLTIFLKIMPGMLNSIGFHGAFSVLGLCTAVGLLVLYFILPETKDRTLQEIEEYFNCGRFREQSKGKIEEVAKLRNKSDVVKTDSLESL